MSPKHWVLVIDLKEISSDLQDAICARLGRYTKSRAVAMTVSRFSSNGLIFRITTLS